MYRTWHKLMLASMGMPKAILCMHYINTYNHKDNHSNM